MSDMTATLIDEIRELRDTLASEARACGFTVPEPKPITVDPNATIADVIQDLTEIRDALRYVRDNPI